MGEYLIMLKKKLILKIICVDKPGIVADLTTAIYFMGGNILSSDQFSDPDTNQFFMRLAFEIEKTEEAVTEKMCPIFEKHNIDWQMQDSDYKPSLLILCSKQGHCLHDLLMKWKNGSLKVRIPAIISNHKDLAEIAGWYKIPFIHLPVTPETKVQQEEEIRRHYRETGADLIILARYMQILSPGFCADFSGKVINIHHSFLPGFKGANPYRQAFERGVKIIGATGHFVTSDLDEGPIIEQETIRVDHAHTAEDLTRYGADIEALVLSRAVKLVTEQRVFIDKNKTVVFN